MATAGLMPARVNRAGFSQAECLAETVAWLDLLYEDVMPGDGELVVVAANRITLIGMFDLTSGVGVMKAARAIQASPGCFYKVNLMDGQAIRARQKATGKPVVGRRDEVKSIVSFHLDVDAGKSSKYVRRGHALWALDAMPCPPTYVVNSNGDDGGFHAYWILEERLRIKDAEHLQAIQEQANRWQNRLAELCGGKLDSTSNLDRLLRPPGVQRDGGEYVWTHSFQTQNKYQISDLQA